MMPFRTRSTMVFKRCGDAYTGKFIITSSHFKFERSRFRYINPNVFTIAFLGSCAPFEHAGPCVPLASFQKTTGVG